MKDSEKVKVILGKQIFHFLSPKVRYILAILSFQESSCRKSCFNASRFGFNDRNAAHGDQNSKTTLQLFKKHYITTINLVYF